MMSSPLLRSEWANWLLATALACSIALTACGSSSNDSPPLDNDTEPAVAAEPTLTFHSVKTYRFIWSDVSDATHYRLLENPDGVSGFTQVGSEVLQGSERIDHVVPLYQRINAQYILQSCTTTGCVDSSILSVSGTLNEAIGHLKTDDTTLNEFGNSVSLSADGTTLAIGAFAEDGEDSVFVFTRSGIVWSQQANLKVINHDRRGFFSFGLSVSISADGNTLAVGAPGEQREGAVYVFTRSGTDWNQQAFLKSRQTELLDRFGGSVSLSADGITLAIGASSESSGATGVNGDQADNSLEGAGAAYVFTQSSGEWSQQAYIKASNTDTGDSFGGSVSLSTDGNTLAVGASHERSTSTGVNGDQSDNSTDNAGAVYVFARIGSRWNQQAYLKANDVNWDEFGASVSISDDGNTLAVGVSSESSNATGVNGDYKDNSVWRAGAVYVFIRSGADWSHQAYIKASNTDAGDEFGDSVSLSANGNTLAVGARLEKSASTGINGDQNDNSSTSGGAVYVFIRSDADWSQQAYIKASNTDAGDDFGGSVSLSADGNTLSVGSPGEVGNLNGNNGDQSDNSLNGTGAVYLY